MKNINTWTVALAIAGMAAMVVCAEKIITTLRARIDQRIGEVLSEDVAKIGMEKLLNIPFSFAGKRHRPILLILTADALGIDENEALNAAVGVELIHDSSLVFDDVIDRSTTRRGFPALHKIYGEGLAISIGLFLASKGINLLTSYNIRGIDEVMADALLQLSEGEILDASAEDKINVGKYLTMIKLKSGVLFGLASAVGATLGKLSKKHVGQLWRYGMLLGISYQVADDLLDSDAPAITNTSDFSNEHLFIDTFSDLIDIKKMKEYLKNDIDDPYQSPEALRRKTLHFLRNETKRAQQDIECMKFTNKLGTFVNDLIDASARVPQTVSTLGVSSMKDES